MGIRITAFALDCGGFKEWLYRPVGEVLFYVARHAVGDPVFFNAFDPESQRRFVISPKREVVCIGGSNRSSLTPESASQIPVLAQPLKESLESGDSYPFLFLFDSLAACPEVRWVRLLTRGHRYGWVFSLLQAAKDVYPAPRDLSDLEDLCARILRGHHFQPPAYPLKSHKVPPPPDCLPVFPKDDTDAKMAVFSTTDCVRWFELIDLVTERAKTFRVPAEWMRVADADVDNEVRFMLDSLDAMRSLPLEDPRMVTFIS